jgi:hypothetical protein
MSNLYPFKLRRRWIAVIAVAGIFIAFAPQSYADNTARPPSRHALVLGNDAYANNRLTNPRHDAELMAQTLTKLNFEVVIANNLNRDELFSKVREFSKNLPDGAIALIYYAGHGMQLQGANYLIPIDMQPTGEQSVPLKAFPLQSLIDHLHAAPSAVNIIILDACRNNPFRPASVKGYRDFANMGLAKISAPKGTVIAYSTAPGQFAEDGQGRSNSLYTETLAQQFQQTGLTIEEALKNVADIVRRKTLDDQQPWYETSLVDSFYFIPPPGVSMLTKAPVSKQKANVDGKRGPDAPTESWYLSLEPREWALLEDQLQNRASYLTEDEIPLLKHRADQSNVIAMTTLGLAYRDGFLQGRDENGHSIKSGASNKNSIHWLQQAAEAGFPIAQRELGEMILQGIGTDADEEVGMRWLERASHVNYPLGNIHYAQRRVDVDPSAETQKAFMDTIFSQARELNDQRLDRIRKLTAAPVNR